MFFKGISSLGTYIDTEDALEPILNVEVHVYENVFLGLVVLEEVVPVLIVYFFLKGQTWEGSTEMAMTIGVIRIPMTS